MERFLFWGWCGIYRTCRRHDILHGVMIALGIRQSPRLLNQFEDASIHRVSIACHERWPLTGSATTRPDHSPTYLRDECGRIKRQAKRQATNPRKARES